jgi:hypothetical protein
MGNGGFISGPGQVIIRYPRGPLERQREGVLDSMGRVSGFLFLSGGGFHASLDVSRTNAAARATDSGSRLFMIPSHGPLSTTGDCGPALFIAIGSISPMSIRSR